MIESSKNIVFFTGAGISTESGIPDFRSPGGIWTKMAPIQFQDFLSSEEMRRESWRRKFEIDKTIKIAQPNAGHYAIARLIKHGKASSVITQNIDNLHQQSGIVEENVIELHGNGTYASCLTCSTRYELEIIKQSFLGKDELPLCKFCGGLVKTATISFGQAMPVEAMQKAEEAALSSDLFLAIGSSLVVHPAAQIPMIAKQNGAGLVILNREQTPLDPYADLVINDEIGPVLSEATNR
ncbi:MAG: NAD-dependent deacetylase [Rhodospirillaceae bacterium]|nr:NAD-dependent deacetylase [Rhodospirillaceae bacterium]